VARPDPPARTMHWTNTTLSDDRPDPTVPGSHEVVDHLHQYLVVPDVVIVASTGLPEAEYTTRRIAHVEPLQPAGLTGGNQVIPHLIGHVAVGSPGRLR